MQERTVQHSTFMWEKTRESVYMWGEYTEGLIHVRVNLQKSKLT